MVLYKVQILILPSSLSILLSKYEESNYSNYLLIIWEFKQVQKSANLFTPYKMFYYRKIKYTDKKFIWIKRE